MTYLPDLKAIQKERSDLKEVPRSFSDVERAELQKQDSPLSKELAQTYGDTWKVTHEGTVVGFGAKCKLRPYQSGGKVPCPKGMTGHHVVPDRCFRIGSREGATQRILEESEGLVICVDGKDVDPSKQHGKIHKEVDGKLNELGKAADSKPPGTAKLGPVEDAAAEGTASVTGCSKDDIKNQLREYHDSKGLGPDSTVRASQDGAGLKAQDLKKKATEIVNQAPKV